MAGEIKAQFEWDPQFFCSSAKWPGSRTLPPEERGEWAATNRKDAC